MAPGTLEALAQALRESGGREVTARGADQIEGRLDAAQIPALAERLADLGAPAIDRSSTRIEFRIERTGAGTRLTVVEWAGDLPGGTGYTIRKLRYEAVPGLWIPALLYEPDLPESAGKLAAENAYDQLPAGREAVL
jgi:hypothetical protein